MKNEDVLLIKSVLDGSTDDFAHLVNKYKNLVFSLAFRFFNNKEIAEDISQETFIKESI